MIQLDVNNSRDFEINYCKLKDEKKDEIIVAEWHCATPLKKKLQSDTENNETSIILILIDTYSRVLPR